MDAVKVGFYDSMLRGKKFLAYDVIELIGSGHTAAIFKIRDRNGVIKALKIFDTDYSDNSFNLETRINLEAHVSNLNIHNLLKIFETGKTEFSNNVCYYVVMEYIEGWDLQFCIKNLKYDTKFVMEVVEALLELTNKLLQNDIVHRDIKLENVMVDTRGNVKLVDLTLAKIITDSPYKIEVEKLLIDTNRYAPTQHEFISADNSTFLGWKYLNLVQIENVFHSLLVKKEKIRIPDLLYYIWYVKRIYPSLGNIWSHKKRNMIAFYRARTIIIFKLAFRRLKIIYRLRDIAKEEPVEYLQPEVF